MLCPSDRRTDISAESGCVAFEKDVCTRCTSSSGDVSFVWAEISGDGAC